MLYMVGCRRSSERNPMVLNHNIIHGTKNAELNNVKCVNRL